MSLMRICDELEIRTSMYWGISSAFHRRQDPCPTTGVALKVCGDAQSRLNPSRPLHKLYKQLNHAIIMGRGKKRKTPKYPDNAVIQFGT